jgi:alanine racemase
MAVGRTIFHRDFGISLTLPKDKSPKNLRPSYAEIDLASIAHNLKGIRKKVGETVKIMAVVKANAYGHGDTAVSGFIEKEFADYFGVAFVEEGIALRKSGIKKPILVFTLPVRSQIESYFEFDLEPTICTINDIDLFDRESKKAKQNISVHLKIETGMNRIGVQSKLLKNLLPAFKEARRVELKGVYTHFATADQQDKSFTRTQFDVFQSAVDSLHHEGLSAQLIHCANSSAILDLPETYCDMVRPGIMMYGYYPSFETSKSVPLKPALSVKTAVSFVKKIDSGESVSYGRRFIAKKRTKIATLPLGYADGYPRLLSGKTLVLINGKRYPVAGTICMDQMMVDVGDAEVGVGDEATLVGRQVDQQITCWDLAERIGTIPYEILCGISARMPRTYKE